MSFTSGMGGGMLEAASIRPQPTMNTLCERLDALLGNLQSLAAQAEAVELLLRGPQPKPAMNAPVPDKPSGLYAQADEMINACFLNIERVSSALRSIA